MTADGRIANWEWSQRDLSTARVQKHREERRTAAQEDRAAKKVVVSPAADDPSPKPANDETDVKRNEAPATQERKSKSQSPPLTPPLEVVDGGRQENSFAGASGTRALARPGSRLSEAELKKRRHDVVVQRVIAEAARIMRSDRFEEFAAALCDPSPPRWAREERDRLWRQVKRERNACGAAHAA
jgi:hypothetical protein